MEIDLKENIDLKDNIFLKKEIDFKNSISFKEIETKKDCVLKPTGVYTLDNELEGGIPSGSVVYLAADPLSMSESFIHQFTQTRKTYYFTTERRPAYIIDNLININFDVSHIIFIDVYGEYYLTPYGELVEDIGNEFVDNKIVEFVENTLRTIPKGEDINIIFDTFSFFLLLNIKRGKIKKLMNVIYDVTKETGALTFLYGLKNTHDNSIEKEVLNQCDVIIDIELDKKGDKITSKLTIPKVRKRIAGTNVIKFKVKGEIVSDTKTILLSGK